VTIELNGEAVEVDQGATVATLVQTSAAGVAVAVDGEVVPKSEWGLTPLSEGQRVEVVGAIQGG
jgi:sulfur carrier protein